jgi:hypothetical protein
MQEKLKRLDNVLVDISIDFAKALENSDKNEFLKTLNNLQNICQSYHFEYLYSKIEEWEKIIESCENFKNLKINYDNISNILIAISEQVNIFSSPSNIRDQVLASNTSNRANGFLYNSNSSFSTLNDEVISNNLGKSGKNYSNFTQSPLPVKRTLASNSKLLLTTNHVNVKIDDDLIFQELKPLKFDGLFKQDFSAEEISEMIKKIEMDQITENTPITRPGSNPRNFKNSNNTTSNIVSDNAYPFKQDSFKFNCNIY